MKYLTGSKLFTFTWKKGSVNDNIIKYCKNQGIDFRYNSFGNLELDIEQLGVWFIPDHQVKKNKVIVHI